MPYRCQLQDLPLVAEGEARTDSASLLWKLKLILKRRLSAATKLRLKRGVHRVASVLLRRHRPAPVTRPAAMSNGHLQAGDLVRVRSREQIEATLDTWQQWKGCTFMPGMWQYCGTTQIVLKPVERFLDERDYRVKQCRGIILLDGLMCQGLPDYGRCDRSCLFFWREEWLERLDGGAMRSQDVRKVAKWE